jgi:hypothetical protein
MAKSTKTRPPAGWSNAGTKRRESYCVCPKGHRFVAELFTAVDLYEHPEVLEILNDAGLQPVRCPTCGAEIALAEAFLVDQPERRRRALFVPDALAHRELELRAEMLVAIAASPSPVAPPYFSQPEPVVGVAALQKWLFGEAPAAAPAPPEPPAPRVAPAARKSKEPQPVAAPRATQEIHAAFADLEEPDKPLGVPSIPPSGPQMEGVDVNEPLLDEDWLADDAIAPSKPKPGDPASGRRSARAKGDAAGGRAEKSGVNFADLLADDDADPMDDLGDEGDGARPKKRTDRDDG